MREYLSKFASLVVIVVFLSLALVPWAHWFDSAVNLSSLLSGPSFSHPLGTDNLGRDILVRISQAIFESILPIWILVSCISLVVVISTVLLLAVKTPYGLDRVFFRMLTLFSSVPVAVVAFIFAAIFSEAGILPVAISLTVLLSARTASLVQQLYLRDHNRAFWVAHEIIGGSRLNRIVRYGVLGEWRAEIGASILFHLQACITIEAAISYLGFGVQEPSPSFGNILAAHLDRSLAGDFYVVSVVLVLLVLTAMVPQCARNLLFRPLAY